MGSRLLSATPKLRPICNFEKKIEIMEKKVESKPAETKHHEEHKEEAEWHQKGSNSTSSWHRVMKVTKETSSKTEECTRTYKVVGGKKILVEFSNAKVSNGKDDRLPEIDEKEKREEGDQIKSVKACDDSGDDKEDGKAPEETDAAVVERGPKTPITKCACCPKCNIM